MAGEGLPVQLATRVLGVAESGYYEALTHAPSTRSVRHAWVLDQIREVHLASNGTYGARRVHAELTLGRGIAVGHNAVEMLMTRNDIRGVTGRPRWKRPRPDLIAKDLVDRGFRPAGAEPAVGLYVRFVPRLCHVHQLVVTGRAVVCLAVAEPLDARLAPAPPLAEVPEPAGASPRANARRDVALGPE